MTGVQRHVSYLEAQALDGTGLLCGAVRFQHQCSGYILDALPPVLVLCCEYGNDWLPSMLKMILCESLRNELASKVILDKLAELLFTYAIRQYLTDTPGKAGVLALYGHPSLAKAIEAIHRNPDQEWTLESMAKEAALSRTVFAETFRQVSGWTAGQYLLWWRMQLAWSLLSEGKSLAEVAGQVGYRSGAAFSRAFQKTFNVSAGQVRRGQSRGFGRPGP